MERRSTSSALFRAALMGHAAEVAALLRGGADPNECDDRGLTPLFVAANDATRAALLEAGADASHRSNSGLTIDDYQRRLANLTQGPARPPPQQSRLPREWRCTILLCLWTALCTSYFFVCFERNLLSVRP